MDAIQLILPFPPSVNHYWRNVKGRVLISKAGRGYIKEVGDRIHAALGDHEPIKKRLSLEVLVHCPDKRQRDLDNLIKAIQDSLTKSGLIGDDSQIDRLLVVRGSVQKPGSVHLTLETMDALQAKIGGQPCT